MRPRYRSVVQYVVGVVVLVYAGYTYWASRSLQSAADSGLALGSQVFSASVIVAMLGLWVWDRWIWRWPAIQRIPAVTRDVSGTWKGTFESLWKDPATGEQVGIRDAYLSVHQTFSSTHVTFFTAESKSRSLIAAVTRDSDGTWCLTEIYRNQPRITLQAESRSHLGAMVLEICGVPAERMEGHYWSDRNSSGEILLSVRKSPQVSSFSEAARLFG